jgi:hypothetical protein
LKYRDKYFIQFLVGDVINFAVTVRYRQLLDHLEKRGRIRQRDDNFRLSRGASVRNPAKIYGYTVDLMLHQTAKSCQLKDKISKRKSQITIAKSLVTRMSFDQQRPQR